VSCDYYPTHAFGSSITRALHYSVESHMLRHLFGSGRSTLYSSYQELKKPKGVTTLLAIWGLLDSKRST